MKLFNSIVWFSEVYKIVVVNITYILIYLVLKKGLYLDLRDGLIL